MAEKEFTNVLVTGGAGFIGSHIVDKLVKKNYAVTVVDNLSSGKIENLGFHVHKGRVMFVQGDIRNLEIVEESVKDVDAVVHLAAVVSVPYSVKNPEVTNDVNVNGTLNLLDACARENVEKFVFISSCAVYGEPNYLPLDEAHPTKPLSPYADSKLAAEVRCEAFGKACGLKTVVLRLFNVYGRNQRPDDDYSGVITKFVHNLIHEKPLVIYGDGEQTRDFVHVSDVVKAVVLALENEKAVGETFNVGSGKPTSINELASIVAEAFGVVVEVVHSQPRIGDLKHSYACITKAEKRLGFKPSMPLKRGLRRLEYEK